MKLTIRNRKLWNLFPFANWHGVVLQEPIYLSFASSVPIAEQRTQGSHCEKSILCKRQNKCTCLWHFHYFAFRVSSIRLTWPTDTCLHPLCSHFILISSNDKFIVPILADKSILYNLINDQLEGSSLVISKLSYSSR